MITTIDIIEVILYGVFLRSAVWHVRRRQYLQMIGWLLFCQVLTSALDQAQYVWQELWGWLR